MSIDFKKTIVHVLDINTGLPLLSTKFLSLNDESESFITKHLVKIFESPDSHEAVFKEDAKFNEFLLNGPMDDETFIKFSQEVANWFYKYMEEYGTIQSGDLVITSFLIDSSSYIGIFKLNYREEFTHFVEQTESDIMAKIIKNKGIFPQSKSVNEGVIISTDSFVVTMLDKSKADYLEHLFDIETKPSTTETIKALETVATDVIEHHYDNTLDAMTELKHNITESINESQEIPIKKVMEKTFGKDEEVMEHCMQRMEEYGILDANVEVTDNKISNKFSQQKLKTDTGVEIKLPTSIFKDPDFVEVINEPNGTISILIKNISQIASK